MTNKGNLGKKELTGQLGVLRQMAEKIVSETVAATPQNLRVLPLADPQRVLHDLQVHQIELELQNEELRRAQDALEISRERYFDLYDLAPAGYFTLDEHGLILEANLTGANLLDVMRGALIKQPFGRFVFSEDSDRYYLHCKQLFKTGVAHSLEVRLIRQDGAPFSAWLETAIGSGVGGERSCRVVVSDITERKVIEEKLRHSLSLLQNAGKMAQLGGWTIKLPGHELNWSDEMCVLLDFPKGTVPSLPEALALYPRASYEIIAEALKGCEHNGTPFDCELEIFTATRRPLYVRAIGQAVRDALGNIIAIEGAFQDITEGKKSEKTRLSLEAQLRESQKMEAIGTLAGGVAHDFNNILGTILGNADLARQDAGSNWQALVSLDEIQKAGLRAKDLVQQILAFSRRQPTALRVMSLTPLVEESVRLLRALLPGGVRIEYRCSADTPPVAADPTQIKQILINLGTNAAHAMRGQPGNIDICVENFTFDLTSARFDLNLRPGRYARITFSDTGQGMDAATQRRIFEPFFTTKLPGEGTGLGLAVVHGIMQSHDGVIVTHSEPGRGSRFELYFPTERALVDALGNTESARPASEGRGQHIIYIDDDESSAFLFKRLLERWGYRASIYQEQREALDAICSGDIRADLVVTDFNMPGLSGLDVARAIGKALPDVPVIMVSGYVTAELRIEAAATGVRALFSKPVNMEELRDLLQELVPPPSSVEGARTNS